MSSSGSDHLPARIAVHFDPNFLDVDALKVIRRLKQHGYEAYLVGGCVRDLLLGEYPKDFDVATSARPNEIKKVFRNCRIIGRRFRLAHILFSQGKVIEVATFRGVAVPEEPAPVDTPGHPVLEASMAADETPAEPAEEIAAEGAEENPPEVNETTEPSEPSEKARSLLISDDNVFGDAESDAIRRDFTVNALFYDPTENTVLDYVGGMAHIEERRLVCIGDPATRFREDPVRIIRALKFSAKLDLKIDAELEAAMRDCHDEIAKAASARIVEEIFKILGGKGAAQTLAALERIGILKWILPILSEGYRQSGRGDAYWYPVRAVETALLNRTPGEGEPAPPALQRPTRAILFAALIAPLIEAEVSALYRGDASHDQRTGLHNRIQELGMSMRNARKDTYRAQQFILGQDRLARGARVDDDKQESKNPRRRRTLSPRRFAERAYFSEALQFFWLNCCIRRDIELWEKFRSWGPWMHVQPGATVAPPREGRGQNGETVPSRRRNRRRRRRWKEHLRAI